MLSIHADNADELGTYALPIQSVYLVIDRKGAEFIDNKHNHIQTLSFIYTSGSPWPASHFTVLVYLIHQMAACSNEF